MKYPKLDEDTSSPHQSVGLPKADDGSIDWDNYFASPIEANNKVYDNPSTIVNPNLSKNYYRNYREAIENKGEAINKSIQDDIDSNGEDTNPRTKPKEETFTRNKLEKLFPPREIDTVLEELKQYPFLRAQLIDNKKPFREQNGSNSTNIREWHNRWGKLTTNIVGNTFIGASIALSRIKHFGSIGAHYIGAIPETVFHLKGTEITYITRDKLEHKGKQLIRRGFLTNVAQAWGECTNMEYIRLNSDTGKREYHTTLDLWGEKIEYKLSSLHSNDGFGYHLCGYNAIGMIKDLLWLYRNKALSNLDKYVSKGQMSVQLYNVIMSRVNQNKTIADVVNDLKINSGLYEDKILYHTSDGMTPTGEPYSKGDIAMIWSYPKYPIAYLQKILEDLTSGQYFLDVMIPIIKDTRHFPIQCKDTRVFPMTDEKHNKNKDDYDLTKFVSERGSSMSRIMDRYRPNIERTPTYCPYCGYHSLMTYWLCPKCGERTKYLETNKFVVSWIPIH